MKKTYFITATLTDTNKVVTVWLKATSIITAINNSFSIIEKEYPFAQSYEINSVIMGEKDATVKQ